MNSERTRDDRLFQCSGCRIEYGVPAEDGTDPFPCRHCDEGTVEPLARGVR